VQQEPAAASPSPGPAIAAAIRREREQARLSITELARRAGIAKSTLSQLESGTGSPNVETLWALAVALDVPFSQLVDPPAAQVRVVRAGQGPRVPSEHANYAGTLLSAGSPRGRRDIYVIELSAGAVRRADPHISGSVEHLVVAEGRIRVGPTNNPIELDPGDYASFPGDVPHFYEALTPHAWWFLVMDHR